MRCSQADLPRHEIVRSQQTSQAKNQAHTLHSHISSSLSLSQLDVHFANTTSLFFSSSSFLLVDSLLSLKSHIVNILIFKCCKRCVSETLLFCYCEKNIQWNVRRESNTQGEVHIRIHCFAVCWICHKKFGVKIKFEGVSASKNIIWEQI